MFIFTSKQVLCLDFAELESGHLRAPCSSNKIIEQAFPTDFLGNIFPSF